jgi:hypothetical protein
LTEGEATKTGKERANELLRSGRLVFLETAGYTAAQITGLGDLALVPSEKVSELLRKKALDAIARSRLKRRTRVQLLRKKRRKRKAIRPVLREETTTLKKLQDWARDWILTENELKETISSDKRETVPTWEYDVMLETYGRMLDSKARRMAETE